MNLRGLLRTTDDGRFWLRTITPASYPIPTDGPIGELLAAMGRSEIRPHSLHRCGSRPRERDDSSLCRGESLSRVRRRLRSERNAHRPFLRSAMTSARAPTSRSAVRSISWNGTSYSRARATQARSFIPRHDLSPWRCVEAPSPKQLGEPRGERPSARGVPPLLASNPIWPTRPSSRHSLFRPPDNANEECELWGAARGRRSLPPAGEPAPTMRSDAGPWRERPRDLAALAIIAAATA
jgi:Dioxygenase